ncbi:carboxypeptidase-like regulatory domain-containing protein, partial [Acidobacteria bacterium ACD]|nr:carboxypeptidase-like regulatory domain-containing protein [Acidobacteria bacterium ACD]
MRLPISSSVRLAFSCAVLVAGATPARAEPLEVAVRDSLTGAGLPASVEVRSTAGTGATATGVRGRRTLTAGPGESSVAVTARGYRPLSTRLRAGAGAPRAVTFWLDPDEPPAELRPEAVRARTGPGLLLLHGHVADGGSLLPLPGVRVSLARAGLSAVTDERGYFAIRVSLSGRVDRPGQDDLVLEREGLVTRVERRTLLPEGDVHLLVDLAPGAGREEVDARHRLLEAEEEAPPLPPSPHAPSAPAPEDAASVLALPSPDVLTPVAPPASIRVGTSCSCTTCSGVSVMSLETYVKRGQGSGWPEHCPPIRAANAFGWDVINPFTMRFIRDAQGNWDIEEAVEVESDVEFTGGVIPHPQLNAWFWEKGQQRPHVISDEVYAQIRHQVKVSTFLYLRTEPEEM